MKTQARRINRIAMAAVFIAASVVLGFFKLPATVGSVALDSSPGYFLSGYLGPVIGGLVGAIGHIGSAASAGFPLGHVHLYVAVQMFFWCMAFGSIIRAIDKWWATLPATAVATFLNGAAGPWMLGKLGVVDTDVAMGIIPYLTFASFVNLVVASIALIWATRGRRTSGEKG